MVMYLPIRKILIFQTIPGSTVFFAEKGNIMSVEAVFSNALLFLMMMDPFGNLPVFVTMLKRKSSREYRHIIFRESIFALIAILIALFAGGAILKIFHLSENKLGIAGGLILFIIGLKMVFSGIFGKKKPAPVEVEINIGSGGANTAVFSGSEINYSGQEFTGTALTAIFGGIDCDLRGAIIEKDCRINITSVFGGIDLYMPENVNVSTNVTGIFGGADSKISHRPDGPTVYIEGACIFGGVDIK